VLTSLLLIGAIDALERLVLSALGGNGSQGALTDSGATIQISISAGIGRILAMPIASAALIAFVRNLERGGPPGFRGAWSALSGRLWRLIAVQLVATVLVLALAVTIIGIPLALRKFVDWQFAQQEVLYEDRSIRDALRGSASLVRGHWWHTAAVAGTFWVLSEIPGPFLLFGLLFTTLPLSTVNIIGSVVAAVLLPYIQVGRTLLYLDLAARRVTRTAPATLNLSAAGAN
jgi:hypothetical protein